MKRLHMLFIVLSGIILGIIGIVVLVNGKAVAKRCTAEATGTVVEIVEEENFNDEENRMEYTYYPVIEYKANGETITKKSSTGVSENTYKENDKIEIMYNPKDVEEYIIKGDNSSNMIGIIMIVVGAVITLFGTKKTLLG